MTKHDDNNNDNDNTKYTSNDTARPCGLPGLPMSAWTMQMVMVMVMMVILVIMIIMIMMVMVNPKTSCRPE